MAIPQSGPTPAPECLSCGACCFSRLIDYVRVTGDDHARMGSRAGELVHFTGNRAYLNMFEGHCIALVIDPSAGTLTCNAYAIRPDTCRDLTRGEAACRGELAEKSARPLVLLKRS